MKSHLVPFCGGVSCILVGLFTSSVAEIIPYYQHYIQPLRPEYLTIPKFAAGDVPHWSPGKGRSFIDLSRMTIHNECNLPDATQCRDATFQILMFEEPKEANWMTYWPSGNFCCTSDLITEAICPLEQLNKMIIPTPLQSTSYLRTISVRPENPMTFADNGDIVHHEISKSGIYVLFMGVCDVDSPPLRISGTIDSVDPYGYLPADLFGDLPFYGGLSLSYTIVGAIWLLSCFCYRENLMPLQFWITLVLALGMLETTVLFGKYLNWNDYGSPAMAVTFVALFFGVLKRAVSRVVVLLVTLGYGVVRPTLGSQMPKVLGIGFAYFSLSLYYTVATSLPTRNRSAYDASSAMLTFITLLLAGVDTAFYCWTFTSINNILEGLAVRKQAAKYILYRNFRNVLFISLFANVVWVIYGSSIHLDTNSGEDSNWKDRWTVDALWEVLYFGVFVAIAIMWSPANDLQKHAYSAEVALLENDQEWLAGSVELSTQENVNLDKQQNSQDAEYGGSLDDDEDPYNNPYKGKGALDPLMASAKKQ